MWWKIDCPFGSHILEIEFSIQWWTDDSPTTEFSEGIMQRGPFFMTAVVPPYLILIFVMLGSLGHACRPMLFVSSCSTRIRKLAVSPSPLSLPPQPSSTNSSSCQTDQCPDGYAAMPSNSPCGCVIPIKVGLEFPVGLDTLFPSMIELAIELAKGSLLLQSQVQIKGADPITVSPPSTLVTAYLVPLNEAFDNTTAQLIAQRFWTRAVFINESVYGNYTVEFVDYPGLGPSPPGQVSDGGNGVPSTGVAAGDGDGDNRPVKWKGAVIDRGVIALIVLSSVFGLVVVLGAVLVVFGGWNSSRPQAASMGSDLAPFSSTFRGSGDRSMLSSMMDNSPSISFISSVAAYTGFVRTFTLLELEKATQRFTSDNFVGEGGFGRVYRGVLEDGSKVAVKVISGSGREFLAEVEMLSRLHHRNLVKLVGVCTEDHTKCLVYELVTNGSLESHLHGPDKLTAPLQWGDRIKIALGAARGLAYLHEDSNPPIIHRDFKASNILLEDDCTPKVSDFGLAKVALEGGNGHVSTRVMGTFGYVAPEYAMTGHLLVKSDVYSYGVVLLELLTGRQPVDMTQPSGQENLVTWARPFLTNKEALSFCIDPCLGDDYPHEDVAKVAAVAYMCVHPEVSQRPFMGEVVQSLKLVYHESEAAEGKDSLFASRAVSPTGESDTSRLSDHWGTHPQFTPDGFLLMRSDYDSESLSPLNMESDKPASAARGSSSLLFQQESSGSFQRPSNSGPLRPTRSHEGSLQRHSISGPLRPTRSQIAWYKLGYSNRGMMSENGRSRGIERRAARDYYDLWP